MEEGSSTRGRSSPPPWVKTETVAPVYEVYSQPSSPSPHTHVHRHSHVKLYSTQNIWFERARTHRPNTPAEHVLSNIQPAARFNPSHKVKCPQTWLKGFLCLESKTCVCGGFTSNVTRFYWWCSRSSGLRLPLRTAPHPGDGVSLQHVQLVQTGSTALKQRIAAWEEERKKRPDEKRFPLKSMGNQMGDVQRTGPDRSV